MAEMLSLEIVTPERLLVREEVTAVQVPAANGYLGILPGHAALPSELAEGTLSVTLGGQTQSFQITGGFVEVRNNHVRVLADKAG